MKVNQIESLRKTIKGKIFSDNEVLEYYSVDSSAYRIKPKLVVIPKDLDDIIQIIKFAKRNKLSVTPRGAGTGLVGNSLNCGIILDLINFNQIDVKKSSAIVGPGTRKGDLDKILKKSKRFFPPNPSIGPYCSVGGMIGNNASGSRTVKYGSVIDNLKEITFVDGMGRVITLPGNKKIGRQILNIAKRIHVNRFPKTSKNSCGYRLDAIKNIKDTHRIIAGSEGTLGIIVSARLHIRNIPCKKHLFVLEYKSLADAVVDCKIILKTKPSALEFVDKHTMRNIEWKFDKYSTCLLFVEYDSRFNRSFLSRLNGKITHYTSKQIDIDKWWRHRDSSLYYSIKAIRKSQCIPHIIEDATVPVERLVEFFDIVTQINHEFKTKSIMYGHIGNGNIHLRLISRNNSKAKIKKIATKFFTSVIKIGGTITGEHGDGLARSEFVRYEYGTQNYNLFRELKDVFDPCHLLNPNKIITDKSIIIQNIELS